MAARMEASIPSHFDDNFIIVDIFANSMLCYKDNIHSHTRAHTHTHIHTHIYIYIYIYDQLIFTNMLTLHG